MMMPAAHRRSLVRGGRPLLLGLALALMLPPALAISPASAVTKLEGEYNLQLDIRKQDRSFDWDFDSNNNDTYSQAQFRLFTQPKTGVEAFLRYEAEWNTSDNNNDRPIFLFREAHGRYRWELNGAKKGFDTYLFARQDRFWVDNYLIPVVRNDEGRDGGNAQGIRVDSWGFLGGLNATAIVSDFSGQYNPNDVTCLDCTPEKLEARREERRRQTDDGYVLRLRRTFDQNRLRTGFTYNRRVENQSGVEQDSTRFAEVLAGDVRYTFKDIDFSMEYAQSRTRGPEPGVQFRDGLDQELLGVRIPDSAVILGEIRSLRLGNARLGYLNVAPTGWFRGPTFDNRMGESNRDERGYVINTWYLVPARAITLTNNWLEYRKKATLRRHVTEFYSEAYIEFLRGFTGKTYYRQKRTIDDVSAVRQRIEKNDDFVFWISVESQLAWFRLSGKIKNMGTPFQKELGSIETSINLGAKTKLYTRLVTGDDPTSLRRSLFTQIQYRPSGNMELFLEYGPGFIGDSQIPVDDGDLEGSGRQKDIIKVFLRGTF